jgi:hypothetical protein
VSEVFTSDVRSAGESFAKLIFLKDRGQFS